MSWRGQYGSRGCLVVLGCCSTGGGMGGERGQEVWVWGQGVWGGVWMGELGACAVGAGGRCDPPEAALCGDDTTGWLNPEAYQHNQLILLSRGCVQHPPPAPWRQAGRPAVVVAGLCGWKGYTIPSRQFVSA